MVEDIYLVERLDSVVFFSISPSSQFFPVHPTAQLQLYPPGLLLHVPPFLHGLLKHSSTSKPIEKERKSVSNRFTK